MVYSSPTAIMVKMSITFGIWGIYYTWKYQRMGSEFYSNKLKVKISWKIKKYVIRLVRLNNTFRKDDRRV